MIQFALAMVIIRAATSVLTPAEMGRLSLVTAITAFFALTLVNPVGMFINRRLHAWEIEGRLRHNFRTYWLYLLLVSSIAGIVIWVAKSTIGIGLNLPMAWILILVGGSLIFGSCNQTYIPSLNLMGHPRWFITLTIATLLLGLSLSLLLTRLFGRHAEYWVLGLLLGQTLVGLIGRSVFFRLVRPSSQAGAHISVQRPQLLLLFAFAWPLSLSVGLNWVQLQSYRFVVQKELGLAQLGILVAGYTIGAGIIIATEQILSTYFLPAFYKRIATGGALDQTCAWNDYASALFPSIIVANFAIAALTSELIRILAAPQFQSAARFVIWGAIAESARVLVGTYSLVAHARMQTRVLLLPYAVGACSSVVLVYLLVSRLGIVGAVIGLAVAGAISVVVSHGLMRSQLPISIPARSAFAAALCGIAIFALTGMTRSAALHFGQFASLALPVGMTGLAFVAAECWLLRPHLSASPTTADGRTTSSLLYRPESGDL